MSIMRKAKSLISCLFIIIIRPWNRQVLGYPRIFFIVLNANEFTEDDIDFIIECLELFEMKRFVYEIK
ncbi:hypothetical protein CEP45_02030 [Mergibacter septicus]|nr:hypothetical protein CEP45_02030 [Mergibacter septicus]